jgi:2-phosphosulfolactate phosphatase
MRADLHFTPAQADEIAFRDRSVVVIDVLRASTSIVAALSNGARQIIPATTIEVAAKISGSLFGDAFLRAGERNGRMIEGFALGNSPSEFRPDVVRGKSIVFSSTNGSQALVKGRFARDLVVCGFVNISAVAAFLQEKQRDFTILCAGNNGRLSLEDSVCAGMLLHRLPEEHLERSAASDGIVAALALFKTYGKNILKMLKMSEHGRFLQEIGFREDLDVCAGIDTLPVVPQMQGNVIKMKPEAERKEDAPLMTSHGDAER